MTFHFQEEAGGYNNYMWQKQKLWKPKPTKQNKQKKDIEQQKQ